MSCMFVFFFKQKTAYEMRISDWSSDVCSSDLTYAAAAPPVAALFAIMSKVGIYVILRLSSLFFGQDDGAAAGFADTWLTIGGLATIAYVLIGVLSSKTLTRVAGYYVLISSGKLLEFGRASCRE